MTQQEARELAGKVRDGLPMMLRQRLKSIHVACHLHEGHTTVRIFTVPKTADDPDAYVFDASEL